MISEILLMSDYKTNLKRVCHIIKLLDNESSNSIYPITEYSNLDSNMLWNHIQYHKIYINSQNKLQILIGEAIYLLKLIFEYENINSEK